jgi:2-desacetyl-2-hydroxyethyl bacteriochlorophyllide A dehydrogenase
MKAVIYNGEPGKVALVERDIPAISDGEALLKVRLGGICGTDVALIAGKMKITPPIIPGHEFVAEVAEVRGGDKSLIGRRVVADPTLSCGKCQTCRLGLSHVCSKLKVLGVHMDGVFTEYIKMPISKIHMLPDGLSDVKAILVEPTAVAVHVVRRAAFEVGESALVVGAGPVGLLIAQVCRAAGAGRVVVMEINPYRLKVVKNMSLETIDPGSKRSSMAKGFDVAFEASGSQGGMEQAMKSVRPRGRIVVVGLFKDSFPMQLSDVLFRELEIKGSRVYGYDDFPRAINLIAKNRVDVSSMVTHVVPLAELERAVALAGGESEAMKVAVEICPK